MKSLSFSLRLMILTGGAAAGLLGLAACGDEAPRDNMAMLPPDQRTAEVPWNKPEGWENNSQLGALAQDPRIGGHQ